MSECIIAERSFSSADVMWFAAASGDWNSVHTNPVHARRLLTGKLVVHGMFTLLWALEEYFSQKAEAASAIAANFMQPVGVDEHLTLLKEEAEPGYIRLVVRSNGNDVLAVLLTIGGKCNDVEPHDERPPRTLSEDNTFLELKNRSGNIRVTALEQDISLKFINVKRVLGGMPVAALLTLSRLVGMECPGSHSLFTALNIQLDVLKSSSDIDWSVVRYSVPHAPLRLSIDGAGISGHLETFVRPSPVSQIDIEEIAERVNPTLFGEQVALIIGGSRGLGEVTAKIVAAGGGHSVITYHQGVDDAERVVAEIGNWGGRSNAISLDVANPQVAIENLKNSGIVPTHLYYFASPRIASNKSSFDVALWRIFTSVFVEGFAHVIHQVKKTFTSDLKVFYPSTVYIDEQLPEFCEYISAKSAGETMCAHMTKHVKDLNVFVSRLPRMPTDQTAGLIRLPTSEPLPFLLEVVTEMQNSTT